MNRAFIRDGLRLLGKKRLVLGIHDASFPGRDDEDLGRGSPYSRGAEDFFAFAAGLGFDGVQLGPQGITHRGSPSPYEGTLFSRSPLSLPPSRLLERGLVRHETLDALRAARPEGALERMPYHFVFDATKRLVEEAFERAQSQPELLEATRAFARTHAGWLEPDALYDALCEEHQRPWFRQWHEHSEQGAFDERLFAPVPGEKDAARARLEALRTTYRRHIERHAFTQWLLDQEHTALRRRLAGLGLALFGDLQIGLSAQDSWAYRSLFLSGYRMGAPPSRTNPSGQPWGYVVLDPAQYGSDEAPGPARAFVAARARRMLDAFDGVRIDHPHGWIDPWVYREDDPDPLHAVQTGARLFSSPDLPDHPRLAPFAIARPDQLSRSTARHADDFVQSLDEDQVARYAVFIDLIVEGVRQRGRASDAIVCEVLSTLPYPVARVLERHGLGRFRVTQKARLDDPSDVYRSENARPNDWIMLGNHDTPPIWRVVDIWYQRDEAKARAEYLAARLSGTGPGSARRREVLAEAFVSRPGALVHALFTDALASAAENVFVFFADLFGMRALYNEPGEVNDENWTLRAPHDFRRCHRERVERDEALDLPRALALALRARGGAEADALARTLDGSAAGRR
ncbi:MAG: 4-alpha-glucanotransferase [Myxococcaceae bacterium]|nr:4-alpha-glucanotransferase [Myxococcaceae bacterium]